jgi:hypothetical protein
MLKPTGHRIPEACDVPAPDRRVSVVAALINPAGPDKGLKSATILNITPNPVVLSGWKLSDGNKNKMPISDVLNASQTIDG